MDSQDVVNVCIGFFVCIVLVTSCLTLPKSIVVNNCIDSSHSNQVLCTQVIQNQFPIKGVCE